MRIAVIVINVLAFLPGLCFSQLSLDVVYPRGDFPVTATDSTFVFGSVNAPTAQVLVNDLPMQVYSNGAFLGEVPVVAGHFNLHCVAINGLDTVRVERAVYIPPYLTSTPRDTFAIDSSFVFPGQDMEIQAGDYLKVMFKGTPGMQASFSVDGIGEDFPMAELPPHQPFYWGEAVFGDDRPIPVSAVEGIYSGTIQIPPGAQVESGEIKFRLRGTDGGLETVAPGRLTVRNDPVPQIAQLTAELTVARTAPGMGYDLFLPAGVHLWITGKQGRYVRARLNAVEDVWVPEANVQYLAPGSPLPSSTISLIRTEKLPNKSRVKMFLQQPLPFRIEQSMNPSKLLVTIYGATSDTDWIRYDFDDPMIRQITWSQPANGVYQLEIDLNLKQQWGYYSYYVGNNFILDIRRQPKLSFKGMLICVDPGHAPDPGAIGPTRLREKDANLALSLALKKRLEDKGATVFLTREDAQGASLSVRPKMAALIGADLLISIHHNALPDGVDPFRNRGSSCYYYQPQSRPLAVAIQKRLLEKLKLRNFGLYYDNLALCRPHEMPAVLLEPAFIMHPEAEMLMKTEEYRQKTAEAIVKGIEDFMKQAKD